jgi:hypothetical protein
LKNGRIEESEIVDKIHLSSHSGYHHTPVVPPAIRYRTSVHDFIGLAFPGRAVRSRFTLAGWIILYRPFAQARVRDQAIENMRYLRCWCQFSRLKFVSLRNCP